MAPKLTRMADRIIIRFAAHDRRGLSKTLKGSFAGCPRRRCQVVGDGVATRAQEPEDDDGSCRVYRGPELLHRRRTFLERRSFTEIPRGSNSIETRLSVVNCLTERRFLIILGATRTLLR